MSEDKVEGDVAEVVEEQKPKTQSSQKSKVKAVRITGIRNSHVTFKAEVDGALHYRLIPVNDWNKKKEQEFEKVYFLGSERPAFASR